MMLEALLPRRLGLEPLQFVLDAWPVFSWVPTGRLRVDRSYQRGLSRRSERLVERIARGFDPAAFGVLTCRPEGDLVEVIDGQHRALAALAIGLEAVPALVLDGAGAARFLAVNSDRLGLTPLQRHCAAVAAGVPEALALEHVLEDAGVRLAARSKACPAPGTVDCVGLLLGFMARDGGPLAIEAALSGLVEAGQADGAYMSASVIRPAVDLALRLYAESGEALARDLDLLAATFSDAPAMAGEGRRRAATVGGRSRDHACQLMAAEHARLGGTEIAVGW